MSRALGLTLLLSLVLGACTDAPADGPPGPTTPPARLDLRAATGIPDLTPVGVTVDLSGNRYFLDEQLGIFRFDADGRATRMMAIDELPVIKSPVVTLPYTDLVYLEDGLFALTAVNDGFLLNTIAHTLTQYFCYVPDGTPAWLWQRTDALAYDAVSDRIWAQPRTYDTEGVLQSTEMAAYDRHTGVLTDWYVLSENLFAGAMIVLPDQRIFAAEGSLLKQYVLGEYTLTPVLSLADIAVQRIDGLALDGDKLLVLDGATDALWELDAAEL
jgi:hypothetical protein